MNTLVIKRDGSKEPYDPEKIDRVVVSAGVTPDQATEIVARMNNWLTEKQLSEITSLELRDKVIEELRKTDLYAANMFEWYQKTKENTHNLR